MNGSLSEALEWLGVIVAIALLSWLLHPLVQTGPRAAPVYDVMCGISSDLGPASTVKGQVTNAYVTDAGAIRGDGFLYVPGPREVCLIIKAEDTVER